MIDLLSYMFLSVVNVLLISDFECSHFVNKVIYQFLIVVWCVCSFWFIENLSSRMRHEAFDSHEQCDADGWVEQIVVDKLNHENPSESVDLKLIPPLSKIKLQKLINVFCLIICFWVKDSREFDINIHVKAYLFPKIADELEAIIWYNKVGSTVFLIEFDESNVTYTDSINLLHKYECGVFWEVIYDNHHIGADLPVGVDEWR